MTDHDGATGARCDALILADDPAGLCPGCPCLTREVARRIDVGNPAVRRSKKGVGAAKDSYALRPFFAGW